MKQTQKFFLKANPSPLNKRNIIINIALTSPIIAVITTKISPQHNIKKSKLVTSIYKSSEFTHMLRIF